MYGLGKVDKRREEERGKQTSAAVITNAFQSILGSTFFRSCGFGAMLSDTNSQSLGCRGKEADVDLQALTAQVRKLRVRTFIFAGCVGGTCGRVVVARGVNMVPLEVRLVKAVRVRGSGFVWGDVTEGLS